MTTRPGTHALRAALTLGSGLLLSCGGGDSGTTPQPTPPTLASVSVTPNASTVYTAGATAQFTASARASDGSTMTGRTFTWTSSDLEIASVSSSGLVTATGTPGRATITASTGGRSGSAIFEVVAGPQGGTLTAANGDVQLTVPAGALAAEVEVTIEPVAAPTESGLVDGAVYEFGPDGTVFDPPATLMLAFDPDALEGLDESELVLLTEETDGVWEPVEGSEVDAEGNTVTALIHGFSGKAVAARVRTVEILPTALTLEVDESGQIQALLRRADGRVVGFRRADWTSSDPGIATVEPTGRNPLVTGMAGGSATITATVEGVSEQITVVVAGEELVVTTTELPRAVPGVAYSATIEASGGEGAYTWTLVEGSLPEGLSLNEGTGEITGTPTGETSSFTVQVESEDAQTATRELTIEVNTALMITTEALPDASPASAYEATLEASGGEGAHSWSITGGSLPAGLELDPNTGVITGTPTGGTQTFTVRVQSEDGQTDSMEFTLVVYGTLSITTSTLPPAAQNSAYSTTLAASGGDGVFTWSLTEGTLPTGLSLAASTGVISGTATADGSTFTAGVASGDGQTASREFTIDVTTGGPITLEPGDLCSEHPSNSFATFEDANVEAEVRNVLGIGPDDDLTCEMLLGIDQLDLDEVGGTSLVGLQNLLNVTELDLEGNSFTDLSPIGGLTNVHELWIGENGLSDIGPLSGMTALVRLEAEINNISDLSALSGLTNLTDLSMDTNEVSDLGPLSGMAWLEDLDMSHNEVSDTSPLSGLTGLIDLQLDNNQVTDIGGLAGLTAVDGLSLSDNDISDLSPLVGLTNLRWLDLDNNAGLSDIQPLIDNPGIGEDDQVGILGTSVSCTDVATLQGKWVFVDSDCVWPELQFTSSDMPFGERGMAYSATLTASGGDGNFRWSVWTGMLPAGLTLDSETGEIGGTPTGGSSKFDVQIESGYSQVGYGNREYIFGTVSIIVTGGGDVLEPHERCSDNAGTSIATFADADLEAAARGTLGLSATDDLTCDLLAGITDLNLGPGSPWRALVSDTRGLQNLTNLETLNLRSNLITEVGAIAELASLRQLLLHGNAIADPSQLAGLVALETLELSLTGVTDISFVSGMTNLSQLYLDYNDITDISVLESLTSLNGVGLACNASLSNVDALINNTGLTAGDFVRLSGTAVSGADLAALQAKGVALVTSSCF